MTDQPGPPARKIGGVRAWLGTQAGVAGRWALALGGAALLLMMVFPPAAPVPAAAALVIGIRTRRRARRTQTEAPGARAGVIMGSIALVISIPLGTTQIIFWGELDRYLHCREAANTITDEHACKDTLLGEVEKKLDLRQGSLKHYNLPL